jgi:hypothetical protein
MYSHWSCHDFVFIRKKNNVLCMRYDHIDLDFNQSDIISNSYWREHTFVWKVIRYRRRWSMDYIFHFKHAPFRTKFAHNWFNTICIFNCMYMHVCYKIPYKLMEETEIPGEIHRRSLTNCITYCCIVKSLGTSLIEHACSYRIHYRILYHIVRESYGFPPSMCMVFYSTHACTCN